MRRIDGHALWQNDLARRMTAVGLLVLLVGSILWGGIIFYSDSHRKVRHLEALLARYNRAIEREPFIRQRLAEIQDTATKSTYLLAGESEALAGAQLQEHLKGIVLKSGGKLASTQSLKSIMEGSLQKITVRAQATASTASLQKILYALEAEKPYIYVENMDVKTAAPQKQTLQSRPVLLKVTIDLYGYRRRGEKD